jgi:hypothetical protein
VVCVYSENLNYLTAFHRIRGSKKCLTPNFLAQSGSDVD